MQESYRSPSLEGATVDNSKMQRNLLLFANKATGLLHKVIRGEIYASIYIICCIMKTKWRSWPFNGIRFEEI
jgi:hypothetical protein